MRSPSRISRRFNDITIDMERKTRCIDESLLWDDSIESAFWHAMNYIGHCASKGIISNPDKFHFAETEVEFAGFLMTADGVRPTERRRKPYCTSPHQRALAVSNPGLV